MGWDELTKISAFIVYTNQNNKIFAQYYDSLIPESKRKEFEEEISKKYLSSSQVQVFEYENTIVVIRTIPDSDLNVFVVGNLHTNELLFDQLLDTFSTALELVIGGKATSSTIATKMDLFFLLMDDLIDQGFVFEGDPEVVASRVVLANQNVYAGKARNYESHF